MVQEVRQQDHIIRPAIIDVERTAGQQFITARHSCVFSILQCHFQDVSPVQGDDVRLGVLFSDFDAEQAMPRGDIEHFVRLAPLASVSQITN